MTDRNEGEARSDAGLPAPDPAALIADALRFATDQAAQALCESLGIPYMPADVLGYLSRCNTCDRTALTRTQHPPHTWKCPSCADFQADEPVAGQRPPVDTHEIRQGFGRLIGTRYSCSACGRATGAEGHDCEGPLRPPPVNVEYGRGYRDGLRAERRLGPPELTLLQIEDGPAYRITGPLPDDHPRAPGWYFERIPPEVEPPRLIAHAPCDLDPCSGYHCSVCGQEAVLGHICTPNTKEGNQHGA